MKPNNRSQSATTTAPFYPYVNFGKLDTMVVIVHHDRAKDALVIRSPLPPASDTVELSEDIIVKYNAQNGDLSSIEVKGFEGNFLPAHREMARSWHQIKAAKPAPRRVELTPFIRQLFDHIRQALVDHQDRSMFRKPIESRMNWR